MTVIDTSVLSLAFRRRKGVVRRPSFKSFDAWWRKISPYSSLESCCKSCCRVSERMRNSKNSGLLQGFPVILATRSHHVAAARIANACRRSGIAVSAVDCLIAATAVESGLQLLTTDTDFERIAPLRLETLQVGTP